jgi:hypothetical protein
MPASDPPGADDGGSERLIRLPRSAWCFAPLSGAPAVADLPASQAGHVTFGSFNNLAKITPYTMQLWARILQQGPRLEAAGQERRLSLGGGETAFPGILHRSRNRSDAHRAHQ